MRRRVLPCLLAAAALLSTATSAFGASLVVDRTSRGGRCDDGRPPAAVGARTPWCSLTRAAAAAQPGATIRVRRARYPRLELSGRRFARAVRFRAYGDGAPTVDGLTLQSVSGVRFAGLRLTDVTRLTDVADFAFDRVEVAL